MLLFYFILLPGHLLHFGNGSVFPWRQVPIPLLQRQGLPLPITFYRTNNVVDLSIKGVVKEAFAIASQLLLGMGVITPILGVIRLGPRHGSTSSFSLEKLVQELISELHVLIATICWVAVGTAKALHVSGLQKLAFSPRAPLFGSYRQHLFFSISPLSRTTP